MQDTKIFLTVYFAILLTDHVSGSFPTAQNVTWSSFNFKTLLTWSPKPTNYSYTTEYSIVGQNRQRNPHCIRSLETECDLTNSLTNLKVSYSADVLSEPLPGVTSDLVEFPHASSERFCPYTDTRIGRPQVKIELSKDQRKLTLYIVDPLTAIFNEENQQLSIRDIFKSDLKYRVIYRKAESTGKKVKISESSTVELTDLDLGNSYCFNVEAYIPSRRTENQLGDLSHTQCSPEDPNKSFIEDYGVGVIVGSILLIIAVVLLTIVAAVICCKQRNTQNSLGKEGMPLNAV